MKVSIRQKFVVLGRCGDVLFFFFSLFFSFFSFLFFFFFFFLGGGNFCYLFFLFLPTCEIHDTRLWCLIEASQIGQTFIPLCE